jgi:hypothetical protein
MEQKHYQIRIKGHLDEHWSEWLGELTLAQLADGTTTLTGEIVDRAALYGVLNKLDDMGLSLISVNEIEKKDEHQPIKKE